MIMGYAVVDCSGNFDVVGSSCLFVSRCAKYKLSSRASNISASTENAAAEVGIRHCVTCGPASSAKPV